jgi:REP element-mobilizing transposase RayT
MRDLPEASSAELFLNSAACNLWAMSRHRRLVICNLRHTRRWLEGRDFEILARGIDARRQAHGFLLTAWVFLPDHWHAVIGLAYPKTISLAMESIQVSSTRQIHTKRKEASQLWQGLSFDRALRTVKEYSRAIEYTHWNPVKRPGERVWSSQAEYAVPGEAAWRQTILSIDRVRISSDERTRI